jgi:hypothetical protein
VHWTGGIHRHFQAFSTLRVYTTPRQSPRHGQAAQRLAMTIGFESKDLNHLHICSVKNEIQTESRFT